MLYFEAAKDRWAFSSAIIYMNLGQDAEPGKLINSGKVMVKQFAWEVAGLRKLRAWLDAGIGFRLNRLNAELDVLTYNIGGGTTARNKSHSQTWADPIIIARAKSSLDKKFVYQFRGDLGGFGIGSDFTCQIQAYAGCRLLRI